MLSSCLRKRLQSCGNFCKRLRKFPKMVSDLLRHGVAQRRRRDPAAEVVEEDLDHARRVAIGEARAVRRGDDVGQGPERRVGGQRLVREARRGRRRASRPPCSASISAGSSTTSPRDTLTSRAPWRQAVERGGIAEPARFVRSAGRPAPASPCAAAPPARRRRSRSRNPAPPAWRAGAPHHRHPEQAKHRPDLLADRPPADDGRRLALRGRAACRRPSAGPSGARAESPASAADAAPAPAARPAPVCATTLALAPDEVVTVTPAGAAGGTPGGRRRPSACAVQRSEGLQHRGVEAPRGRLQFVLGRAPRHIARDEGDVGVDGPGVVHAPAGPRGTQSRPAMAAVMAAEMASPWARSAVGEQDAHGRSGWGMGGCSHGVSLPSLPKL